MFYPFYMIQLPRCISSRSITALSQVTGISSILLCNKTEQNSFLLQNQSIMIKKKITTYFLFTP